jgi:DNA-directed RNA polymerase specialized sigma24 family protein
LWIATSARVFAYFVRFGVPEDHADDLVQEVFAVVMDQYHRFDGGNAHAWVFTLARYELLSWRARAKRSAPRSNELQDIVPVEPDSERRLQEMELVAAREAFRCELDEANAMILDHLGSDVLDDELLDRIADATSQRLSLGALRDRRLRLRRSFAAFLSERGLP